MAPSPSSNLLFLRVKEPTPIVDSIDNPTVCGTVRPGQVLAVRKLSSSSSDSILGLSLGLASGDGSITAVLQPQTPGALLPLSIDGSHDAASALMSTTTTTTTEQLQHRRSPRRTFPPSPVRVTNTSAPLPTAPPPAAATATTPSTYSTATPTTPASAAATAAAGVLHGLPYEARQRALDRRAREAAASATPGTSTSSYSSPAVTSTTPTTSSLFSHARPQNRAMRVVASRSSAARYLDPERREGGTGPSMGNVCRVSEAHADLALVRAAITLNLDAARDAIVYGGANLNVLVRPKLSERSQKARPTTALMSAVKQSVSSAAAAEQQRLLVELLLASGADPNHNAGWLRATTPLHEATTPDVAELLLAYGARSAPLADNPREPPPAWYHKKRGRHDVAKRIKEWRRRDPSTPVAITSTNNTTAASNVMAQQQALLGSRHQHPFSSGGGGVGDNHPKLFPGLPLKTIRLAMARFAAPELITTNPMTRQQLSAAEDDSCNDCPICLEPLSSDPPCTADQQRLWSTLLSSSEQQCHRPSTILATPCPSEQSSRHAFHAACLCDWLRRSCRCPMCKADLRPFLRDSPSSASTSKATNKKGTPSSTWRTRPLF